MTDQIAFQGPYETNERSAIAITARFRASGADTTPTNVYWRLDDAGGCQIQDWTSVTADDEVSITIGAGLNAILNCFRLSEAKILTVMADRGLAGQFSAAYRYDVKNLPWRT